MNSPTVWRKNQIRDCRRSACAPFTGQHIARTGWSVHPRFSRPREPNKDSVTHRSRVCLLRPTATIFVHARGTQAGDSWGLPNGCLAGQGLSQSTNAKRAGKPAHAIQNAKRRARRQLLLLNLGFAEHHVLARHGIVLLLFHLPGNIPSVLLRHVEIAGFRAADEADEDRV